MEFGVLKFGRKAEKDMGTTRWEKWRPLEEIKLDNWYLLNIVSFSKILSQFQSFQAVGDICMQHELLIWHVDRSEYI